MNSSTKITILIWKLVIWRLKLSKLILTQFFGAFQVFFIYWFTDSSVVVTPSVIYELRFFLTFSSYLIAFFLPVTGELKYHHIFCCLLQSKYHSLLVLWIPSFSTQGCSCSCPLFGSFSLRQFLSQPAGLFSST